MEQNKLGLDLGIGSVGWAMISENEHGEKKILGLGSRVIPLSTDDKNEFSTGNAISKNQKRTAKRTQRKGYDRYQLRRSNLQSIGAWERENPKKVNLTLLGEIRSIENEARSDVPDGTT